MLVLTRKLQETIKIGDDVTIYVLRVKGNTVRLGIDAPRQVRVIRGELEAKPAVGELSADAEQTPVIDSEEPPVEEGPVEVRPALSSFFPRVLRTASFPATSLDRDSGPVGP